MIKYSMTINVDVDSFDSIPALLQRTIDQIENEVISGSMEMEDSDFVQWKTLVKQQ